MVLEPSEKQRMREGHPRMRSRLLFVFRLLFGMAAAATVIFVVLSTIRHASERAAEDSAKKAAKASEDALLLDSLWDSSRNLDRACNGMKSYPVCLVKEIHALSASHEAQAKVARRSGQGSFWDRRRGNG